jgi:hypothetical protein
MNFVKPPMLPCKITACANSGNDFIVAVGQLVKDRVCGGAQIMAHHLRLLRTSDYCFSPM